MEEIPKFKLNMNRFGVILVLTAFCAIVNGLDQETAQDEVALDNSLDTLRRLNCEQLCGDCGCTGFYCGDECICQCDTADDDNVECIKNLRNKCRKMEYPFEVLIQGPAGRRFVRESPDIDPLELEEFEKNERNGRSVYSIYAPQKTGKGGLMAAEDDPNVGMAAGAGKALIAGKALAKLKMDAAAAKKAMAVKLQAFKLAKPIAFKLPVIAKGKIFKLGSPNVGEPQVGAPADPKVGAPAPADPKVGAPADPNVGAPADPKVGAPAPDPKVGAPAPVEPLVGSPSLFNFPALNFDQLLGKSIVVQPSHT